jgi:formamidopyrimidine-DNA glycosylase
MSPLRGQRSARPRLGLHLGMGGRIVVTDSSARVDPDVTAFGPDALDVGLAEFRRLLSRGTTSIKARLLDQSAMAGIGNLLGRVIPARHEGGTCPRCGAPMRHGTVGARSTWWCGREQDNEHG